MDMAQGPRTILFAAVDPALARTAATAFSAAAGRLGLSWEVRSGTYSDSLGGVSVIACVDQASFGIKDWVGRIERFQTRDIESEVNKLLARLLGGSDRASQVPPPPTAPPKKVHTVKLSRETAGRRGKGVTVVSELPLNEDQLKELATQLKNKCGTGGTAKDGRIEIQGDQRDRLAAELEKLGYKVKRAGG
jgi:translation initiation factor 1